MARIAQFVEILKDSAPNQMTLTEIRDEYARRHPDETIRIDQVAAALSGALKALPRRHPLERGSGRGTYVWHPLERGFGRGKRRAVNATLGNVAPTSAEMGAVVMPGPIDDVVRDPFTVITALDDGRIILRDSLSGQHWIATRI